MITIKQIPVKNKNVLLRCDFNVPIDDKGNILDDFRIRATLPTIEFLVQKKAKVILISHLDEPGGIRKGELSLSPIAIRLVELLGREVEFLPDCLGQETEKATREMSPGDVVLLENLRFYKEEKENDIEFAKALAKLGDIFVQDGFGVCHRKHASVVAITQFLPAFAGLLLEKEVTALNKLIGNVTHPFVVVIGGKKVETKSGVLNKFINVADYILVNHLIYQQIKDTSLGQASNIVAPQDGIEEDGNFLDIGPKTRALFAEKIKSAKTILWNGPLGQIEKEEFQQGTLVVAEAITESKSFCVAGGGDTVEFINKYGLTDKFSHVSTGGGAMLAYISGEKLPGLEVLNSKI